MRLDLKRFIQVQTILVLCCLLCSFLLAMRIIVSGKFTYVFMLWNLFLAYVPVFFATVLGQTKFNLPVIHWSLFLGWLLFFPNSIYMISDLLHLSKSLSQSIPPWYDATMLFSFAMVGLFLGIVSLSYIHSYVEYKFSTIVSWCVIFGAVILSGVGVYMGRFLRWNSWDILRKPLEVLKDVLEFLFHPLSHLKMYLVTFSFATILLLAYLFVYFLKEKE